MIAWHKRWLVARLLLGSLATGASAHAFCLTRTCDASQSCECMLNGTMQACQGIPGECVMSGFTLFWSHSCVAFDVQQDGSIPVNGSPHLAVSYEQIHQIVSDAAATWSTADCGGSQPNIALSDFGPATCNHPEYNKSHPNANVIMFHDSPPWPYPASRGDTLALTTVTFDTTTGEIYDADIEINSAEHAFTLDPNGGSLNGDPDLPGVITHEMGHFLGLSHVPDAMATMNAEYETGMAVLSSDDIDGVCAAMANPARTAGADCTPRHGFSKDCAGPDSKGCCSTAVGANASPGQALGLLGFGVALLGWRARRRFRGSPRAARR